MKVRLTKRQKKQLEEAIESAEGLVAACQGDESRCCVFNSLDSDYKKNIRLYTESWILGPLKRLQEGAY